MTPTSNLWLAGFGAVLIGLLVLYAKAYRKQQQDAVRAEEAYKTILGVNQLKDDFLAVMSHELRTPLTAIMGYTELLIDGVVGSLTEPQQDMLVRIDESSKHLLNLIQQVLDIHKGERGAIVADYASVNLTDLVKHNVTLLGPLSDKKGLTVYCNVPNTPVWGDTDISKLRQILINLIGNAVKFTEDGSVTVELRYSNTHIKLCVSDTGPGIPLQHQTQIFLPFFQQDGGKNRSKEGAGLGLAITRELVKTLHGTITVESEVGEGATFCVELPRYRPSEV